MTKPDRSGAIKVFGALFLIFAVGTALRLIPWHNFITPDGVYFLEADNYDHLRKVLIILNDFPHVAAHDYYAGFPVGTGTISSPLFDLTFAVLIKLLSWTPGPAAVAYLSALMPPFLGMLAVVPLFFWARSCFGSPVALLSCAIFVLLPAHISSTTIGRPDNELVEPLWAALLFFTYTAGCGRGKDGTENLLPAAAIGVATGVVASLSLLYWRGAILWWGCLAAHAFFSIVYNTIRGRRTEPAFWLFSITTFAVAALFIAIISAIRPWGLPGGMLFNIVSWFHVVTALIIIAALLAASLAAYLRSSRGASLAASLLVGGALCVVSVVVIAAIAPEYFRGIFQGSAIVGGSNKWTQTIEQYMPLFKDTSGRFNILAPLGISTLLIFVTPVALAITALKRSSAQTVFFAFAGWVLFVLTLANKRYETVLTLVAAVCGALFIAAIYRRAATRGVLAGVVASAFAILILLSTSFAYYASLPHKTPFLIKGDMEKTLVWIRDNTPETSNYLTPSKMPEYGVMARWEFSGWIGQVARRPSVATGYGIEAHGMKESSEFFLSTDNREFLRILDENKARYFILSKTIGALSGYAELLGRDSTGYLTERTDASGRVVLETGAKYFDLVYVNLLLADGQTLSSPIPFKGVEGVRLVYESPSPAKIGGAGREVKRYKVFERVKGAVVKGMARPGQRVELIGVVTTNQSRRFYSATSATAGLDGTFSLKAWYPTVGPSHNGVGIEGGYILTTGSSKRRVLVTERDVIEGGIIDIR